MIQVRKASSLLASLYLSSLSFYFIIKEEVARKGLRQRREAKRIFFLFIISPHDSFYPQTLALNDSSVRVCVSIWVWVCVWVRWPVTVTDGCSVLLEVSQRLSFSQWITAVSLSGTPDLSWTVRRRILKLRQLPLKPFDSYDHTIFISWLEISKNPCVLKANQSVCQPIWQ